MMVHVLSQFDAMISGSRPHALDYNNISYLKRLLLIVSYDYNDSYILSSLSAYRIGRKQISLNLSQSDGVEQELLDIILYNTI